MGIKLKKRTPEESREYLTKRIAGLIRDRRILLTAATKAVDRLEDVYPVDREDQEFVIGTLTEAIDKVDG